LPQPARRRLADKILIQFLEADVDIGFGLVDEAKAYRASGQTEFSARALQEAAQILVSIERQLHDLSDADSVPFLLLLVELRREVDALKSDEI